MPMFASERSVDCREWSRGQRQCVLLRLTCTSCILPTTMSTEVAHRMCVCAIPMLLSPRALHNIRLSGIALLCDILLYHAIKYMKSFFLLSHSVFFSGELYALYAPSMVFIWKRTLLVLLSSLAGIFAAPTEIRRNGFVISSPFVRSAREYMLKVVD